MTRAAATVLLAAVMACGGGPARGTGAPIGMALPALHGGTIDLGSYRGRPVVLHLFTTWSLTAQLDLPQLIEVAGGDPRTTVIGVALDQDGYTLVAPWVRENSVPYLIALATDPIQRGTSPLGRIGEVPTTILLDPSGRIAHRIERPLQPGELQRLLQGLAAQ
jgi:hypothetical protein